MNDKDRDAAAAAFNCSSRLVEDGMENPLWIGNIDAAAELTEVRALDADAAERAVRSGTGHYVAGSCVSSSPYSVADGALTVDFHHQRGLETTTALARPPSRKNGPNYPPAQEAILDCNNSSDVQQTTMMNATYMDRFGPSCAAFPVGPVPGYYAGGGGGAGGGPACGRSRVLPEIDLSHRPGSLQEAICMYIDFLMAENEVRTRISECAVASPPPPLDFHREEYYRDVMCRPVNFPTVRFRDWLKRYNVDIEITDPDGQTVSQTTFAPATAMTECSEPPGASGGSAGWQYADAATAVLQRRRQRLPAAAQSQGVICHGGDGGGGGLSPPTPVQIGPLEELQGHPLFHLQADPRRDVPVEMLGPSSDGHPVHGSAVNFAAPSTAGGPLASSLYQAHPPQDPAPGVAAAVGGCGYASVPVEEEDNEEYDRKEEGSPDAGLPVSSWPDMTLEQPESSQAVAAVDSENFEEDASDQPLTSSSADPYFQEQGSTGSDGHFDSGCFVSEEAAAADQHWTSGVIRSPVGSSIIDVNSAPSNPTEQANFTAKTSPRQAIKPVSDIVGNRHGFPVVIEPALPSGSCISAGNAAAAMGRGISHCFAEVDGGGYRPAYEAGSDQELYAAGADNARLGDRAAVVAAGSHAATPPSHSGGPAHCLDLGSDFADLLGTEHGEELDYRLDYGGSIASELTADDQLTTHHDVPCQPPRQKGRRGARKNKSHLTSAERPHCKFSRRESAHR